MKNSRLTRGYTTIHIPTTLARFIDELIDSGEFAYTSRSEFVKDAIRRSLERHGFYPKTPNLLLESALSNEEFGKHLDARIKQLKKLKVMLLANKKE